MTNKILVIKLSALGDFIQALGAMKAIRAHHKNDHITLLTTKPFEKFAKECGYFDEILIDEKPKFYNILGWLRLHKTLNKAQSTRVYDLQNNDRTNLYFSLFWPKPEWSGTAKNASHRNISKQRTAGHAFDGHAQTLGVAGLKNVSIDTLDWMNGDISELQPKDTYALLVPGSAPQHPQKRWPAENYAALAQTLSEKNIVPVIIGTNDEAHAAAIISKECEAAVNLIGKTDFHQIASLARHAALSVGNDTGPMHLIAATGCQCVTLFSSHSNPVRHAPKGANAITIQEDNLNNLNVEKVIKALKL